MKKSVVFGALVSMMIFSSTAFAGNYGAAGCGLGTMLFHGKNDKVSQVLSATTNGTAGNQTFGITTGTSNCDSSGLVVASKEADSYAAKNYDSLATEMASGSGEHLSALAGLLGYSPEKLGAYSRGNYSRIFASENTTSAQMLAALKIGMDQES